MLPDLTPTMILATAVIALACVVVYLLGQSRRVEARQNAKDTTDTEQAKIVEGLKARIQGLETREANGAPGDLPFIRRDTADRFDDVTEELGVLREQMAQLKARFGPFSPMGFGLMDEPETIRLCRGR